MSKNLKNITTLNVTEDGDQITIDHIWYEGEEYIHLGTIAPGVKLEIGPAIPIVLLSEFIEKLQDVARFYVHPMLSGETETLDV